MNNIILVNKDKNMTSRDVCNIISKILNEKKVGHFGTLDPMATGLLVVGLGSLTKIANYFPNHDKEYEVEVLIGTRTDTYDITGTVLEEKHVSVDIKKIEKVLLSFIGTYLQEVPVYSAVRVNGKRLYKYAREGKDVLLPKKEVTIYGIDNISFYDRDGKSYFSFRVKVSNGTYIRSLINDISKRIDIPLCMSALNRTMCCFFLLKDASTIKDIESGNYKLLDVTDVLDLDILEIPKNLEKKVLNGNKIQKISEKPVLFTRNGEKVVLYKVYNDQMKPFLSFKK